MRFAASPLEKPIVELLIGIGLRPRIMTRLRVDREEHVAPRFFSASTILSVLSIGTMVSLAPWKVQAGTCLIRHTALGSPPPQMGAMAAKRWGWAMAIAHVPNPPKLNPVR